MNTSPAPYWRATLILITLFLCACTTARQGSMPAPLPVPEPQVDGRAAQIWQRFLTRANTAAVMSGPFRISATLRYNDGSGENTRVSSLLWGNGKADTPYPLRLDLLAGVGTVVAKVHEDANSFTAFAPEEKTAWVHDGSSRTLASFGVPIPLSLGDLTLLLTGRSGVLFLPATRQNDAGVPAEHRLTDKGARYVVPDARLPGELELSESGAPVAWTELQKSGWSIEFEPEEVNPLFPEKLRISHPKGYSALIVVKEIARVSPPYSTAQMSLSLPEGTKREPLRE